MTPHEARAILENPAIQGTFDAMRRDLLDDFTSCPVHDTEKMQRIRMQIEAIEDLRSRIRIKASEAPG